MTYKNAQDIPNDIIILGKNRQEHDVACESCCKRLSTLNIEWIKCRTLKVKLEFYSLIFTEKGSRPYPDRVAKLQNGAPPQNASEVGSFLDMANACDGCIPNYAAVTLPLLELTKQNIKFK